MYKMIVLVVAGLFATYWAGQDDRREEIESANSSVIETAPSPTNSAGDAASTAGKTVPAAPAVATHNEGCGTCGMATCGCPQMVPQTRMVPCWETVMETRTQTRFRRKLASET